MYYIFIILVVIFIFFMKSPSLQGFWVAGSQFCSDAEIDNFVLLFKKCDWFGNCAAYVLLVRDNQVIINEPCQARISKHIFSNKYTIIFKNLEVEGFPLKQQAELKDGRLRIYDEDTLYGEFFKDCENSLLLKNE